MAARRTQTFTATSQLGLTDENNLQEICYAIPDYGVFLGECSTRTSSGWKSQLPADYAFLKIEKLYNSRVVLHCYPIGKPGNMYISAYNYNDSPSFKGWYRYTGAGI